MNDDSTPTQPVTPEPCSWAVGEGDPCPNPATHRETDQENGVQRPTCNSCCGATRLDGKPCRHGRVPTTAQLVRRAERYRERSITVGDEQDEAAQPVTEPEDARALLRAYLIACQSVGDFPNEDRILAAVSAREPGAALDDRLTKRIEHAEKLAERDLTGPHSMLDWFRETITEQRDIIRALAAAPVAGAERWNPHTARVPCPSCVDGEVRHNVAMPSGYEDDQAVTTWLSCNECSWRSYTVPPSAVLDDETRYRIFAAMYDPRGNLDEATLKACWAELNSANGFGEWKARLDAVCAALASRVEPEAAAQHACTWVFSSNRKGWECSTHDGFLPGYVIESKHTKCAVALKAAEGKRNG